MAPRIDPSNLGIVLIDVQTFFTFFLDLAFPEGTGEEPLLTRLEHLLMLADWMDLPVVTTFEMPTSTNGELPDRLDRVLPTAAQRFEKDYFGSMSEPDIREAIEGLGVNQVAVGGAETDVCVLQTTLGLLDLGYEVFLLEDCLFTTEPNPGPALRRMEAAGAVPTTLKTLAYELTQRVTNLPWYPEGWTMGDNPDGGPFPEGFIAPEEWPPWTPAR